MKKTNFIVKVFILLKSVLAVLLLISILALASELWTTRNQIEGRELVNAEPKGLASPPPCQMITKKQLVILDFSVSVKILMA